MNRLFLYVILVVASGLFFGQIPQSAHALISGISEDFDQRPELYRVGARIMEFVEGYDTASCIAPDIQVYDVDTETHPAINPDNLDDRLFVVLSEYDSGFYRYLKADMPKGDGYHNFQNYLYDENYQYLTGSNVGLEIGSGVFAYETLSQEAIVDEDKRLELFMEGESKFEAYSYPIKPGKYNFESILYKFTWQSFKGTPCVFVLDWDFVVNDDGTFSTGTPQIKVGTLINITDQFPVKLQTRMGIESWSVTCKEGQSVLSQKEHFFYDNRFACVTPETKSKLIERGWNLAAPTQELTYFEESEELEVGQKFEEFMKQQPYNNVPSAFVIGKHNFKNNGDFVYFCGEFKDITVNYQSYFHGAIDGSGTLVWDGLSKQSAWCAISDDTQKFSFVYDWELEK